jgi:cytoskeletal protein RodZ
MHHRKFFMTSAAIIAVIAVSAIGFAIPQQALAYRHSHNSGIKVDQQISQANVCTGVNEESGESPTLSEKESAEPAQAPTICLNSANNSADVHH